MYQFLPVSQQQPIRLIDIFWPFPQKSGYPDLSDLVVVKKNMAFIPAAATFSERASDMLSADNTIPPKHIIISLVRRAAPLIGLTPPVIATLDAMLSCLPPERSHHTVFASNETLSFRRNGVSDRTIRRHIRILQEADLLERHDSPNRKRFTRHNRHDGKVLRFGLNLSRLYDRLPELSKLAAAATADQERIAYRRMQIRTAANELLSRDPDDIRAQQALRIIRRKLTIKEYDALLTDLEETPLQAEHSKASTDDLAAKDSQNVRHLHKSKKEYTDKREKPKQEPRPLSVAELLEACPEAMQFSLRKIGTMADVVAHARTLAPMIGIDEPAYQAALMKIGPLATAVTVWAMMQFHDRITKVGAYFRAITSGRRSEDFDPFKLIRTLASTQKRQQPFCPRTI